MTRPDVTSAARRVREAVDTLSALEAELREFPEDPKLHAAKHWALLELGYARSLLRQAAGYMPAIRALRAVK